MIRLKLTAFLILSWTASYSQFILNSHQVRAILKDHAELEMRRSEAKVDSAAYQAMLTAFYYKDSAFHATQLANRESDRIGQDWHEAYVQTDKLLNNERKNTRRQKRIKILTMIGAGILIVLAI